jgi:hypothetical protein
MQPAAIPAPQHHRPRQFRRMSRCQKFQKQPGRAEGNRVRPGCSSQLLPSGSHVARIGWPVEPDVIIADQTSKPRVVIDLEQTAELLQLAGRVLTLPVLTARFFSVRSLISECAIGVVAQGCGPTSGVAPGHCPRDKNSTRRAM